MPITPALQIVTWCLLFTSLSILWVSELLPPLLVAAGYGAIGVSAVRVRMGSKSWLSQGLWQLLMFAALLFFFLEWIVLLNGLLNASLHLLLFLMLYKLLTLSHSRDYLHLYLIGFFQLLASTTATAALPYGIIFFVYVMLSPWTLMLYTLQLEAEQQDAHGQLPVIQWPFFLTTTATAVGAFVLTFAIFFLIPRMGSGYLQQAGSQPVKLVGFSERIELGDIGAVKLDPTVVMRVNITSPLTAPVPTFYWRGTAYDYYDGKSWQNRLVTRWPIPRRRDGWYELPAVSPDQPSHSRTLIRQEIFLEPLETLVLFAAANPVAVGGPFSSLHRDGQSTLLLPLIPAAQFRYEVDSLPPQLDDSDRTATVTDYQRIPAEYLQLPPGSDRAAALAREIVGRPAPDGGPAAFEEAAEASLPSVLEQGRQLEAYLKRNYRYTLDVNPPRQLSAIDDFLFVQKAGYCEYYATAMVLMLRGLGIPARLVSGFLQGEWNTFGEYFTVRQQDAHTWVEVYFPRTGWYPFDPTPAVGNSTVALFGRLGQMVDTLRLSWDRYVIRFSFRDQVAAFREIRNQGSAWQSRSAQWIDRGKAMAAKGMAWMIAHRDPFLLMVAAGCFAILFMRGWAQRRGGWSLFRTTHLQRVQIRGQTFYAKVLRLLAKRGLRKPPAMTPLEFLQVAEAPLGPASGAFMQLTAYYQQLRFAAQPLSQAEQRAVSRLLRLIEQNPLVPASSANSPSVGGTGEAVNAPPPNGGRSQDQPSSEPTDRPHPPSPA